MKFGKLEGNDYNNLIMNDAVNSFRIAIGDSISVQNMVDGIVDEYEDQTGVDTGSSVNLLYNATDDYYSLGEGDTTSIDNMEYSSDGDSQVGYLTNTQASGDTVLLLHFDSANGIVDATNRHSSITAHNTAQISTGGYKWGSSSLLVDGDSDYLSIPDSADWDLVASNSDNWTIDFWAKFNTLPTDAHCYIQQRESGGNSWSLFYNDGSGIGFYVYTGSYIIGIVYSDSEITDTDWHHIALVKVADEYAIYIDGDQESYTQDSSTTNLSGSLYIGAHGAPTQYFDGYIDELRIIKSNVFSATPVSGKTDTITVPTTRHGLDSGDSDLLTFSEDTIKQQGTYALKIEASQTNSLNDYITKNYSSPLDLSNRDTLKFQIRASRTGTNLQAQIHDSGGTTSTYNITISSANTWEEKLWDISGISNANKDAIDKFIIKITDADSANTVYIDEIYAYANATGYTLISDSFTADEEPDEGRLTILLEEVNSITLNTDLKAWVSKDGGSTWKQATLTEEGSYSSSIKVLQAIGDLTSSGIGSGTSMEYKITTHNNKNCKIHGTGMSWR